MDIRGYSQFNRLEGGIARAFDRIARDPVRYALYSIAAGILGGGTVFSLVEADTSVLDGWWWAFVSLTTVGYGDIAPKTAGIRMLAMFVIGTGILAVAIITAAISGRIAERRVAHLMATAQETPEFHDDVQQVAHSMREQADLLEALAPEIKKLHEEEADDRAHWQRAISLVGSIEEAIVESDGEQAQRGTQQVKKLCGELRTLAAREGVTIEKEAV